MLELKILKISELAMRHFLSIPHRKIHQRWKQTVWRCCMAKFWFRI